jgi:hypothetical protein
MPKILVIMIVFVLQGCAAHSPFIVKNTADTTPAISGKTYPPHTNLVRVTTSALPADVDYEFVGAIDVGKVWYGNEDGVDRLMADKARALGADAVILVKRWKQPSGFSWAAPHGSGQAVKLKNRDTVDLDALPGTWL